MRVIQNLLLLGLSSGILFSYSSCKREKLLIVQGSVMEFYSQEPIFNAEVRLAYSPLNFGSVSTGFEDLAATQTNNAGIYLLEFEEPSTSSYRIRVIKEGYLVEEKIIDAATWSVDYDNIVDIELFIENQFELSFFGGSNGGSALFQLEKHSEGCTGCCLGAQSYFISGDTVITCPVYGNQAIPYTLTKVGGGTTEIESGVIEVGNEPAVQQFYF